MPVSVSYHQPQLRVHNSCGLDEAPAARVRVEVGLGLVLGLGRVGGII